MATPISPTFHIRLWRLDLDAWRDEFDMADASDRQVLASIKGYAGQYINEHLDRLGIQVH
jgi:hypothetical protein